MTVGRHKAKVICKNKRDGKQRASQSILQVCHLSDLFFCATLWRILTNKEIYASVRKPAIIETIRLSRLHWFGHVQRMEENRIPKRVLYMNLGTTRLRGRPRIDGKMG